MHMINEEDIRARIIEQLTWDSRVDERDIEVTMIDGRVQLSGTAPSHFARHAAETDARMAPGVTMVENQISIAQPGEHALSVDADLQSRIIKVLVWDASINPADIRVRVNAGVAVIEGAVNALWRKQRAEELAYNVAGVSRVDNLLSVVPTSHFVDKLIAEDIMRALARDSRIETRTIDVAVKDGEVQLKGSVSNLEAFTAAEDAARYTEGVLEVENHLLVI